jgi:hypothetical protein
METGSLEDDPGGRNDALNVPLALRAMLQRLLRHFLLNLKDIAAF